MRWIALPRSDGPEPSYVAVSAVIRVAPVGDNCTRVSLSSGEEFLTTATPEEVLNLMKVRVEGLL